MILYLLATMAFRQTRPLLQTIFPKPTGNNGYEEYLAAADLIDEHDLQTFKAWKLSRGNGTPPPGFSGDFTPLALKRYEVEAFGKALLLISKGNSKPYAPGTESLCLAIQRFQDLSTIMIDAAQLSFANGDWTSGIKHVFAGLTFADHVAHDGVPALESSVRLESDLSKFLNFHKATWSVADGDLIVSMIDDLLASPVPIVDALRREKKLVELESEKMASGVTTLGEQNGGSDIGLSLIQRLNHLSTTEREQLQNLIDDRLEAYFHPLLDLFDKPEEQWSKIPEPSAEEPLKAPLLTLKDLARAICEDAIPSNDVIVNFLRSRAQLRLLRVTARVQNYRWRNGRLPSVLGDAVNPKEMFDPLSRQPIQYRVLKDQTYRLYSKGISVTGEIDFLSPPSVHGDSPTPPTSDPS